MPQLCSANRYIGVKRPSVTPSDDFRLQKWLVRRGQVVKQPSHELRRNSAAVKLRISDDHNLGVHIPRYCADERCKQAVGTAASHSGHTASKSRADDRLSWLRFTCLSSGPSGEWRDKALNYTTAVSIHIPSNSLFINSLPFDVKQSELQTVPLHKPRIHK
jgi:hypothetical protein